MTDNIIPFNPLDKRNLGANVAEALLSRRIHPLGEIPEFEGAGIYAIYYTGEFPAYAELSARNQEDRFGAPIYVGKAIPAGARKGGGVGAKGTGRYLFNRLAEHADSVSVASNLNLADFHARFLVVDDIWIPLGESLIIARYSPLWNALIDGFGNHDPGKGRYEGMRPRWDVLHPGRSWAMRCRERQETAKEIAREVVNFLRMAIYPTSIRFIDEDE
jgi:hypothetical protein